MDFLYNSTVASVERYAFWQGFYLHGLDSMLRAIVFFDIQYARIVCSSNCRDDLMLRGMFDRSEMVNGFVEFTRGHFNC